MSTYRVISWRSALLQITLLKKNCPANKKSLSYRKLRWTSIKIHRFIYLKYTVYLQLIIDIYHPRERKNIFCAWVLTQFSGKLVSENFFRPSLTSTHCNKTCFKASGSPFGRTNTVVSHFVQNVPRLSNYTQVRTASRPQVSLLGERRTCDRRVAISNPGRSGGRIFFCRVSFMCWLVFGARSTPVLLQWHVKDPVHSAKNAACRLHPNTHTPLTQQSWIGQTVPQSRLSVGTYPETSLHATCHGNDNNT